MAAVVVGVRKPQERVLRVVVTLTAICILVMFATRVEPIRRTFTKISMMTTAALFSSDISNTLFLLLRSTTRQATTP